MDIGDRIFYIELIEKFACPLVAALPETGLGAGSHALALGGDSKGGS
jgi:hypothetical protein